MIGFLWKSCAIYLPMKRRGVCTPPDWPGRGVWSGFRALPPFLGAILICHAAPSAQASGTYPFSPPKPPGSVKVIDNERYDLGRAVLLGKEPMQGRTSPDQVVATAKILASLQEQLPKSLQTRVNLPAYTGTISERQLEALRYYLQTRYNITAKS